MTKLLTMLARPRTRLVKARARSLTILKVTNIFLEMETVAVVCDDNIECAEARDEALCRTGADKYNPIAYAMTALMGLVYVVLKLVWFFHLQHQPVGDEEDDMELEEMETNQDPETEE